MKTETRRATTDTIGLFSNIFFKADVINKTTPLIKLASLAFEMASFFFSSLICALAAKPILIYFPLKNVLLFRRSIFFKWVWIWVWNYFMILKRFWCKKDLMGFQFNKQQEKAEINLQRNWLLQRNSQRILDSLNHGRTNFTSRMFWFG